MERFICKGGKWKKGPFAAPDSFHIIYSLLWGREGHGFAVGCVKGLCKKVGGKGSEGSKGSKGSEGMDCPSGNEYKVSVTGFAFGSSLAHAEMPKPPSSGRRWRRRRRRIGASVLSLYFRAYPQGFPNVRCLPFCFLCYSRHCGNSHFGACRTTFLPQRTRGGALFPSRYRRGCRVFRRQAEYILIAAKGLGKH